MRILVFGINYWPELTGIAPFTTGRCEYLAAQGHEVSICTTLPYYPEWCVHSDYRRRRFMREKLGGVTILRSRIYVPARATILRRILHETSFVLAALLRGLAQPRPDVVLVVSPPLALALPAVLLSRLWNVPFIFHVPDLQPDAALDLGMIPAGWHTRILYALERLAYRTAAIVSTLTEAMRQRIISKGVAAAKVKLFTDWAASEFFAVPLDSSKTRFRAEHSLTNKFLVLHSGNMGVKQGLEVVLRAAELARDDPGLAFLLLGDGAARRSLEARASVMALSNLRFMPLQPPAEFIDILASTDVALITQQRAVADIVFPSKTMTLMAAGRPLIAAVNSGSEVARVVRESNAGVVVEPENPPALLQAVRRLQWDYAERSLMGRRAREWARIRWSREEVLARTAAEIASLIRPSDKVQGELARRGIS